MEGIYHKIYLLLSINEDMGHGEILNNFPENAHRTVERVLAKHVKNKDIAHDRIRGKGKWKRYFLKEEDTKNNLLFEAVNEKQTKHTRIPITQKTLSKVITDSTKFYRNDEFKKWKKTKDPISLHGYISFNIVNIIFCLKWMSQLTWAIKSGMLGNSKTKLELANRNKERLEGFLSKIIYNINTKNETMMKGISKLIYNEIMDTMIFEESTMEIKKGNLFYQFNKNPKYHL